MTEEELNDDDLAVPEIDHKDEYDYIPQDDDYDEDTPQDVIDHLNDDRSELEF